MLHLGVPVASQLNGLEPSTARHDSGSDEDMTLTLLCSSTETFGLGSSLLGVLLRPLVLVVLCWGEFRGGRGGFSLVWVG